MAADHVVGENLKFGLGIEFGRFGKQKRMARLLAVGFLGVSAHHHLALENAAGLVVHHAFEKLAAGAVGLLVVDDQAGIGMLLAAQHEGAGDLGINVLGLEFQVPFWRLTPAPGGEREIIEYGASGQRHVGVGQVNGIFRLQFDLDAVKPGTFATRISVTELAR